MAEKASLRSATDFVIFTYCLIFLIAGAGTLIRVIFAPKFDALDVAAVFAYFVGSSAIFGLIKSFRKAFDWIQEQENLGNLTNTRVKMLYGLGGVVISTLVPRIAVFFCVENFRLFVLILALSLTTAVHFHQFFIYGYNQHCEYNVWNRLPVPAFFIFILQITSIFMARRAAEGYEMPSHQGLIMMSQLGMLVLSTVASIEYCMVWNGNVTWRGWSKRRRANEVPEYPGSFTESIFCLCQHASFILLILIICLWFNDILTGTTVGIMIGTLMIICGFFMTFYGILRWYMEKMEWLTLTQYKVESCIGLVLMTTCAVVPRVVVYFWALDMQVLLFCLFISVNAALITGGIFVRESSRDWKLDKSDHLKSILVVAIIHLMALLATMRISLSYDNFKETETIMYVQLACTFVSFPTMADLAVILMGGMKRKPKKTGTQLQIVSTVDNSGQEPMGQFQSHECKICCLEHNDTVRIPRVLRECGHTICEPCADILLQKTNGDVLKCPFCQTITIVRGLSKLLPKNYGMLEIIEEHRTQIV